MPRAALRATWRQFMALEGPGPVRAASRLGSSGLGAPARAAAARARSAGRYRLSAVAAKYVREPETLQTSLAYRIHVCYLQPQGVITPRARRRRRFVCWCLLIETIRLQRNAGTCDAKLERKDEANAWYQSPQEGVSEVGDVEEPLEEPHFEPLVFRTSCPMLFVVRRPRGLPAGLIAPRSLGMWNYIGRRFDRLLSA